GLDCPATAPARRGLTTAPLAPRRGSTPRAWHESALAISHSVDAHDDARRPQAARMTNRVLLGSVNARLAPPSPFSTSPNYPLSMAKTCCGPQRGRSID